MLEWIYSLYPLMINLLTFSQNPSLKKGLFVKNKMEWFL